MGLFNIKLKTKNGNDVKHKITFTAWYAINYHKNALTNKKTAEFTYRILSSDGHVIDPQCVLELKDKTAVTSREDLSIKVIVNILTIIGKMSEVNLKGVPDFILIFSNELDNEVSQTWRFTSPIFDRAKVTKLTYERNHVKKETVSLLRDIVTKNPTTKFMAFNPKRDKKHIKSEKICEALKERLERSPKVEEQTEIVF